MAKLTPPYPTDQIQRDWGRENELNPILGFSGDCTPEHPPAIASFNRAETLCDT